MFVVGSISENIAKSIPSLDYPDVLFLDIEWESITNHDWRAWLLSAAHAFLANEEGVVFVGCFSNFLLGCVRSCSRVHAATLQAISGAHIHRKHKGQWTVTEKISQGPSWFRTPIIDLSSLKSSHTCLTQPRLRAKSTLKEGRLRIRISTCDGCSGRDASANHVWVLKIDAHFHRIELEIQVVQAYPECYTLIRKWIPQRGIQFGLACHSRPSRALLYLWLKTPPTWKQWSNSRFFLLLR